MTRSAVNPVLWRYMDFAKFVSILSTNSLYFPSAQSFPDRFEGTINQATHEAYRRMAAQSMAASSRKRLKEFVRVHYQGAWIELPFVPDDPALGLFYGLQSMRARTYVSCWHENPHESEAMWRLYVPDITQGIALRTTRTLLSEALPDGLECEPVQYLDYATDAVLEYFSEPFVTKRIAFQHEREWRVIKKVLPDPVPDENGVSIISLDPVAPAGLSLPLRLPIAGMVTEARLSPVAPPWIRAVYEDLLVRYASPIKLMESTLALDPFSPVDSRPI